MSVDSVFLPDGYLAAYSLLNHYTPVLLPEGGGKGVVALTVSTRRPDWNPDAVFAIGKGAGNIYLYPCKKEYTPLENAVFAIMNAASHAITEGMRVDLQSSGHDDARMFHHCEIKLMLTVYNGLVKASFGKHHDSDPTNSRRTDETYEGTLLPLIGQLTYPETICRDLDSGEQADAAVYHYTDAQTRMVALLSTETT